MVGRLLLLVTAPERQHNQKSQGDGGDQGKRKNRIEKCKAGPPGRGFAGGRRLRLGGIRLLRATTGHLVVTHT